MGLFVEYALLPDAKDALIGDNDCIFAFTFTKEDVQGQC